MTTFTPPTWLKSTRLVCYTPDKVIFEPIRRITWRNHQPCLLDCQEQSYLLRDCEPLQLHHFDGVAVFVYEDSILSVYRDYSAIAKLGSQGFVVSSGDRKAGVRIMAPDEGLKAAKSLAALFHGSIYSEELP